MISCEDVQEIFLLLSSAIKYNGKNDQMVPPGLWVQIGSLRTLFHHHLSLPVFPLTLQLKGLVSLVPNYCYHLRLPVQCCSLAQRPSPISCPLWKATLSLFTNWLPWAPSPAVHQTLICISTLTIGLWSFPLLGKGPHANLRELSLQKIQGFTHVSHGQIQPEAANTQRQSRPNMDTPPTQTLVCQRSLHWEWDKHLFMTVRARTAEKVEKSGNNKTGTTLREELEAFAFW